MAPQLPSKKRTFRRLKQFRCEGYGDCNMKPFHCDYPDCTKQFSRFDNMRQHAQTHLKTKLTTTTHTASGHDDIHIRPKPHHQPLLHSSPSSLKRRKDSDSDRLPKTQGTSINNNSQNGLISPVSLSGTFDDTSQRKKQDLDTLTQDELDALDALNQFRQSPSDGPLV